MLLLGLILVQYISVILQKMEVYNVVAAMAQRLWSNIAPNSHSSCVQIPKKSTQSQNIRKETE